MAFSKESFDISQYKTGWFCAKKGFSKEKVSSLTHKVKRNLLLIMELEKIIITKRKKGDLKSLVKISFQIL